MTVTYENFICKEQEKAIFLQRIAVELGMSLDGKGEIAINRTSGSVYLLLNDYPFVLYLSVVCELKKHDVWVMHRSKDIDDVHEETLDCIGDTYQDIENWVSTISSAIA